MNNKIIHIASLTPTVTPINDTNYNQNFNDKSIVKRKAKYCNYYEEKFRHEERRHNKNYYNYTYEYYR